MADDTADRGDTRILIEKFTQAVDNLAAIAERFDGRPPGIPPAGSPLHPALPTREQVEGLDAAFRYRLLRSLMSAERVEDVVAVVVRHQSGLKVENLPAAVSGTAAAHLGLVGRSLKDGTMRVPVVLPLDDLRIHADVLRKHDVDVTGAIDDLRVLAGPGGPILAVAPSLPPVPAPVPAS